MIRFPCKCRRHIFSLPESESGGVVQCPVCGLLSDVPRLDELPSLEDDGTLKLAPQPAPNPRLTLREATRVFSKSKRDEAGEVIDLRPTIDDFRNAGDNTAAASEEGVTPVPTRPRYDPLTGELIRPIELAPTTEPDEAGQPGRFGPTRDRTPGTAGAPATFATASVAVPSERLSDELFPPPALARLPLLLLDPVNLSVLLFVVCVKALMLALLGPVVLGLWFIAPLPLSVAVILAAHYANCIDDLGPGHHDELPRPLRSAELMTDLIRPFLRFSVATGLAFGPAAICVLHLGGPARFIAAGVLAAAGVLLYPALLITTCVSQHYGNLSPVRVLATVATLGWAYLPAIGLSALAVAAHGVTVIAAADLASRLLGMGSPLADYLSARVVLTCAVAGTLAGVYLAHLAAWTLGVLYRRHEGTFPWIFDELERQRQEHKRLKVLAELERTRARAARAGSTSPPPAA